MLYLFFPLSVDTISVQIIAKDVSFYVLNFNSELVAKYIAQGIEVSIFSSSNYRHIILCTMTFHSSLFFLEILNLLLNVA